MTNQDQKNARRVPTYLADKFLIENENGATVRLTFGEEWAGETTYHKAVRMSFQDAVEAHRVLEEVLYSQLKREPVK